MNRKLYMNNFFEAPVLLMPPLLLLGSLQGPAKVSVAAVVNHRFVSKLEVLGEVEAVRESRLGAEIDGLVRELVVDEGSKVEGGQTLLELKTVERRIRRQRAEAELSLATKQLEEYEAGSRPEEKREAEAAVAEARAMQVEADRELERVRGLRKTAVASEKAYTAAQAVAHGARATLERRTAILDRVMAGPRPEVVARAKSQVAIKASELALIDDEIDKANMRAPFAGIITEKLVEVGRYVRRGDAILSLVQMDPIRVVLAVPEHSISRIRVGMAVRVKLDAFPDEEHSGKVEAVVPKGDPLARTFPVKVRLENPDLEILPGMTARAMFELSGSNALAVPSDTLVQTPFGSIVYVVRDGKAVRIDVGRGRSDGAWIEVGSGIRKGDLVVTRGNELLRPGQAVRVVSPDGSGAEAARKRPGTGK